MSPTSLPSRKHPRPSVAPGQDVEVGLALPSFMSSPVPPAPVFPALDGVFWRDARGGHRSFPAHSENTLPLLKSEVAQVRGAEVQIQSRSRRNPGETRWRYSRPNYRRPPTRLSANGAPWSLRGCCGPGSCPRVHGCSGHDDPFPLPRSPCPSWRPGAQVQAGTGQRMEPLRAEPIRLPVPSSYFSSSSVSETPCRLFLLPSLRFSSPR